MSHRTARAGLRTIERIVGRPRMAKAARLMTNEVRLDGPNDIGANGEEIVQRLALTDPLPIVLDVGAHFGEWAESLLSQPGNAPDLHVFEPSVYSFERAERALAGRAKVHRVGLSDSPGEAQLTIVHEGAGSNSIVPFADRTSEAVTEAIRLSTVDAFCAEYLISRVTLLKIDAEGHDLAVIRGAGGLLSRQAIGLIQFEYNARWVFARNFLLDAFEFLTGSGYSLGKVTPRGIESYGHWHPELETFREANYLAYTPAWAPRLPRFDWWGP